MESENFEEALSEVEKEINEVCRAITPQNCAWPLGQDPRNDRGRVSTPVLLHTLTRNHGLVWSDQMKRWFFPSESLLAQAFPVSEGLRKPKPDGSVACSFHMARPRRRNSAFAQAGNAMHVHVIGIIMLWCLTHIGNKLYATSNGDEDGAVAFLIDVAQRLAGNSFQRFGLPDLN